MNYHNKIFYLLIFIFLLASLCYAQGHPSLSRPRDGEEVIGTVAISNVRMSTQNDLTGIHSALLERAIREFPNRDIELRNMRFNEQPVFRNQAVRAGNFTVPQQVFSHSMVSGTATVVSRSLISPQAHTQSGIVIAMQNAAETIMQAVPKDSKIAILNVESNDDDQSEFVVHELEFKLVSNQFPVVDRALLNRIRTEQTMQLSGEVDDATAVNIGRSVGAQAIITGGITGNASTRRLRIRVVDVETSRILAVVSEPF